MGAINYDVNKRACFLDIGMPQERGLYSEQTAQQIDGEIKRILTEAHDTARRILTERRAELEVIAKRLLDIEVIENEELHRLLGIPTKRSADHGKSSPQGI